MQKTYKTVIDKTGIKVFVTEGDGPEQVYMDVAFKSEDAALSFKTSDNLFKDLLSVALKMKPSK